MWLAEILEKHPRLCLNRECRSYVLEIFSYCIGLFGFNISFLQIFTIQFIISRSIIHVVFLISGEVGGGRWEVRDGRWEMGEVWSRVLEDL